MMEDLYAYIETKKNLEICMGYIIKIKKAILLECILLAALIVLWELGTAESGIRSKTTERNQIENEQSEVDSVTDVQNIEVNNNSDYIKWVDFDVSYEALCKAYELDVETHGEDIELNWIELLAYAGVRTGGEFDKKACKYIESVAEDILSGDTTMNEITKDMEYYPYYFEAYSAVLDGLVGEFEAEVADESGKVSWEKCYGLKGFSPVAKGFYYEDYDDFGAGRSYGYKRKHLGHDMMGQTGTPIIAIEGGTVEALGWNQYGGWRIGIRSHDKKRYYYYAHLRQNYPYAEWIEEGSEIKPGDVIGYMGHTGYSTKENVNNIEVTHLHWGLQLIFDESQKEGDNEIWIDVYALTRFLYKNRCEVVKVEGTKEWVRVYDVKE